MGPPSPVTPPLSSSLVPAPAVQQRPPPLVARRLGLGPGCVLEFVKKCRDVFGFVAGVATIFPADMRNTIALLERTIPAARFAATDSHIPKPLRWFAALGLLPIPGAFDEGAGSHPGGRRVESA
jgi:hypothetical protein